MTKETQAEITRSIVDGQKISDKTLAELIFAIGARKDMNDIEKKEFLSFLAKAAAKNHAK